MTSATTTSSRTRWGPRIVLAAFVWLFACSIAYLWQLEPQPGLLALVVLSVLALVWGFLDISESVEPLRWEQYVDEPVARRGEDPRLSLLTRIISGHLDSRVVMNHQLHRRLSAVADERLMAHHGLSREADPRRAAEVLGAELSGYLEGPRNRRLTIAQIDRLMTRIEAL